jgi:hypothetical protein
MFQISSNDPTKLTLLGTPHSSNGAFPNSVAASDNLKVVCVSNSGATAGVACASYNNHGMGSFDALRPITLSGQTTPPSGPPNTVSQVFFLHDDSALITTVKGIPGTANHGFVVSNQVSKGKVSAKSIASTIPGSTLPFGAAAIPNSKHHIVVADPSIGAFTAQVSSTGSSLVSLAPVSQQVAACWVVYSDASSTAFVIDGGSNSFYEIDTDSGALLRIFNSTNGNSINLDGVAKGDFIFTLSPVNGSVAVFDVTGRTVKDVMSFKVGGEMASSMGLAAY